MSKINLFNFEEIFLSRMFRRLGHKGNMFRCFGGNAEDYHARYPCRQKTFEQYVFKLYFNKFYFYFKHQTIF